MPVHGRFVEKWGSVTVQTMARPIDSIIRLKGELVAETPIHVGGAGRSVDVDLPLARDGNGRYYIPGTSLAGVLRSWHGRAAAAKTGATLSESPADDPVEVRELWGYVPDRDKDAKEAAGGGKRNQGHASHVIVYDAVVCGDALAEVRDGVGIDRYSGAAAEGIKYDREVLPKGTRFKLKIDIEVTAPLAKAARKLAGHLCSMLERGKLSVGSSTTRGLGRVRLCKASIERLDVGTRQGIIGVLRRNGEGEPEPIDRGGEDAKDSELQVEINWSPAGPLMVKAAYDGVVADMLPLVSATEKGLVPVLPGSSIKGAFRSHAERIVRTVLDRSVPEEEDPRKRFLKQVEVPLVDELFGSATHHPRERAAGGKGVLSVADCYATHAFEPETWRKFEEAVDERELIKAVDDAGVGLQPGQRKPRLDLAYRVAVDRWTGGAAERMLYTVLEPHDLAWEPIVLRVDLLRLDRSQLGAALALLILLLRDFASGWIPLGFGTNRGMGAVQVDTIQFTCGGGLLEEPLKQLDGFTWRPRADRWSLGQFDAELLDHLRKEWQKFIDAEKEPSEPRAKG